MKITMLDGQPTIDAADLGPLLGLEPKLVHVKLRSGEITSRFETGVNEDAGQFRLTFYYDGTRVRLTCTADGDVLSTTRAPVSQQS